MFGTTKPATSAAVLNRVLRALAPAGGSSGSAPFSRPTSRGAFAPSPPAPWQPEHFAPYSCWPAVTCSAKLAGAAATAGVAGAGDSLLPPPHAATLETIESGSNQVISNRIAHPSIFNSQVTSKVRSATSTGSAEAPQQPRGRSARDESRTWKPPPSRAFGRAVRAGGRARGEVACAPSLRECPAPPPYPRRSYPRPRA